MNWDHRSICPPIFPKGLNIGHDKPNPQCKRSLVSAGSHGPTWMFDGKHFDSQKHLKHSKTWAQTRLCADVCIAHAWDTMVYTASIHI